MRLCGVVDSDTTSSDFRIAVVLQFVHEPGERHRVLPVDAMVVIQIDIGDDVGRAAEQVHAVRHVANRFVVGGRSVPAHQVQRADVEAMSAHDAQKHFELQDQIFPQHDLYFGKPPGCLQRKSSRRKCGDRRVA